MTVNHRCSLRRSCGARKTLSKHIDDYKRRPVCPSCKQDTLKSVDEKEKERNTLRVCRCDGYHYPHHRGTEPWCHRAKIGPTDEDYEERYR